MADLRCARTRLPIPGTYRQRTVQVIETVRVQEPPDYVTQMHMTGAGVYCSARCAMLHLAESVVLDGEGTEVLVADIAARREGSTP